MDLTTPADRLEPYEGVVEAVTKARRLDIRHLPFPIPDLGVVDAREYDKVTNLIEEGLDRGGVYVHCWGGVGRTGTVIGCLLADQGLTYDAIVEHIVGLRRGSGKAGRPSPEMPAQHELLRRRADSYRSQIETSE